MKSLLEKMIEDIKWIDGGCSQCVSSFVSGMNETLKSEGIPYRYEYNGYDVVLVDAMEESDE